MITHIFTFLNIFGNSLSRIYVLMLFSTSLGSMTFLATTVLIADSATALATTIGTVVSRALGILNFNKGKKYMQFLFKLSSLMRFAIAYAAAIFISLLMVVDLVSRAPRKSPGKARLLFTWFGKSDLPVATGKLLMEKTKKSKKSRYS